MDNVNIAELRKEDRGFALASWRDSHHETPKCKPMPWAYYKREYGSIFSRLLDAGGTLALGAYRTNPVGTEELLGYLVSTPGKRVDTVHWIYVKSRDAAGGWLRRQGLMTDLLAAAELGKSFVYTLQARRGKFGVNRTLDRQLAAVLAARGVTAVYEPITEWLK